MIVLLLMIPISGIQIIVKALSKERKLLIISIAVLAYVPLFGALFIFNTLMECFYVNFDFNSLS